MSGGKGVGVDHASVECIASLRSQLAAAERDRDEWKETATVRLDTRLDAEARWRGAVVELDDALARLAAERERRQREGDEADALWQSKLHAALAEQKQAEERAAETEEDKREIARLQGLVADLRATCGEAADTIGRLMTERKRTDKRLAALTVMDQWSSAEQKSYESAAKKIRAACGERGPAWCDTHQSYSWCEHNGGVMGSTGYEEPSPSGEKERSK